MKASRVKPANPDNKKPSFFQSGGFRWFVIALWESIQKVLQDTFIFIVIAAIAGVAFYYYQRSHPRALLMEKPSTSQIMFSELILALDKYYDKNGVYPKTLRDAYDVRNKTTANTIYRGTGRALVLTEACAATPLTDACWKGFRQYTLATEKEGSAYVFSSESKEWKKE